MTPEVATVLAQLSHNQNARKWQRCWSGHHNNHHNKLQSLQDTNSHREVDTVDRVVADTADKPVEHTADVTADVDAAGNEVEEEVHLLRRHGTTTYLRLVVRLPHSLAEAQDRSIP